jgi:pyruvate/2-oxoglutarate/acetoin dehydrogenase E1 component
MTAEAKTVRITYREAMRQAIREALNRDPRVFLMGEDVGRYGGCFAVSKGLLEEFGPERIRDTPLSEAAFAGAGRQLAAQHSHSLEGWYAHIPGIKVLAPATLEDARGMLWTALEDPDPVLIFEHGGLYNMEGELAADAGAVDIDKAAVRRSGTDVSLITYGGTLGKAIQAADELTASGINAEVVDLRTLRPLDSGTILDSVIRTHRAVIIDEGWRSGSISAEISARIMEGAFYELDAPVARVCSAEVPIPYAKHLEEAALPQVPTIVEAVRRMVGNRG